MTSPSPVSVSTTARRSGVGWPVRRWRKIKDRAARYGVVIGGGGVIVAIALIFFYLLFVVFPLFEPPRANRVADYALPGAGATAYIAMDEQAEVGIRFTWAGDAIFFSAATGELRKQTTLDLPVGVAATSFSHAEPARGVVGYGLSDGRAVLARYLYEVSFPDNVRKITPRIVYPFGETPIVVDPAGRALVALAVQSGEDQASVAAVTEDGGLILVRLTQESSFLDDTVSWRSETVELPPVQQRPVVKLLIDQDQRSLYVATRSGTVTYFDIRDSSEPAVIQRIRVVKDNQTITAVSFLAGTVSLLVGASDGALTQWFPVRDERNNFALTRVREFTAPAAVTSLAHEYGRKGFLAGSADGRVGVYHATAGRKLLDLQIAGAAMDRVAVSPRADALLAEDALGRLHFWRIVNEHPEVSWSSLWGKVWYENYPGPEYVWQSSAASNDFEPKFSLVPISFGTIKAAFYAMIVAIPLAVLGAIFTAHFMAPRMRRVVKPSIEIMEALPTVILGFLAGLWLAPFLENHLPGVFSALLVIPIGVVVAAYAWSRLPGRVRHLVPEGWEAALLVPVVIGAAWLSFAMSPLLEDWLFRGDVRQWLTNDLGIAFDQRNSIVVGIAMGFAVIPTIFSIAEDAIFSVPGHLTRGSLALGATPWQTLWRVVLLTASPGIFSAVMIGMGRAVGETMIVLMATGNTPVMDFSLFQGMRTLSANIAVEMPESEVNSTHYRVLFLAALVLFMFTFVVNTVAEIVRQRLRRKYSSL